jgi:hypothetical protein
MPGEYIFAFQFTTLLGFKGISWEDSKSNGGRFKVRGKTAGLVFMGIPFPLRAGSRHYGLLTLPSKN